MLKLYNTLTKKKEEFKPIKGKQVGFYQCGPTVYWTQHIGNLRAFVLADVIVRALEYLGYQVLLVRNYTDVGHLTGDNEGNADTGEDRMAKGAKREGKTPHEIAKKYIGIFERDTNALNLKVPNIKPKATDHIQEMITMVQTLLAKGFAYTTDLAVYFDVSKAKDYTKLSGQVLKNNISGAGAGAVKDTHKKNPADFALWFFKAGAHSHALQTWPSPFKSKLVANGEGFPGWHIECSAMSIKYLGATLDIHMGGIEHVPVHHTNEIAQSESATGKTFANYWLHNEHLLIDGGKMAKSQGTAYSLAEIIDKGFNPLALRYFFLNAQYRSKQNFTWEAIQGAQNSLDNLHKYVAELKSQKANFLTSFFKKNKPNEFEQKFRAALEDDFNIPQALAVMWDLIKSDLPSSVRKASLLKFDQVLGLRLDKIKKELIIPAEIQKLVDQREQARKDKDFAQADKLRKQIEAAGFSLEDTPQGAKIKGL